MHIVIFAAVVLALLAIALSHLRSSNSWWQRIRREAKAAGESGYMPAVIRPRAHRFVKGLSRRVLNWQVGPIKVIGAENLPVKGPAVIAGNHTNPLDGFVFPNLLATPARYMIDRRAFQPLFGLAGVLISRCGGFCVDLSCKGGGGKAREAATNVVAAGEILVIFPEGYCSIDGDEKPYQHGTTRITKEAAHQCGETVVLIPTYLHYGRYADPKGWLIKMPLPVQYAVMFFTAPLTFRRGLMVHVGKPILSTQLPHGSAEATEMLRAAIAALKAQHLGSKAC